MGRMTEAVKRFILREKLINRFEKEVAEGETATLDIRLEKGTEYVVEAAIQKGKGRPVLALAGAGGLVHPDYTYDTKSCFYFSPEKDGFYSILVAVQPAAERGTATVSITLRTVLSLHQYFDSPWLFPRYFDLPPAAEKEPAGKAPRREAAGRAWETSERRAASQGR